MVNAALHCHIIAFFTYLAIYLFNFKISINVSLVIPAKEGVHKLKHSEYLNAKRELTVCLLLSQE